MTTEAGGEGGATVVRRYPVEVLHLVVSPGHNYFGRPKDGPGDHPTHELDEVRLVAGQGIVGDRFFGKAAHLDASVTLIAVEALEAIAEALRLDPLDPVLARRNVVVRGADLNALHGETFTLWPAAGSRADGGADAGASDGVTLLGGRPAAPCAWMDRMYAPGVHAALRGRGGLRCRVLTDGVIRRGPAVLETTAVLHPAAAGLPGHSRVLP